MQVRNEFERGLLTYFSPQELTKIQRTKIGIAGVGGLGSNIANIMVRTGFTNFELVDLDKIEASNLNRQNYFLDEIGQLKVAATNKRLKQINPDLSIKTAATYLTTQNIKNYFQDCSILFEAFDKAAAKKMLFEAFASSDKLLIFGNGMAGINNHELTIKKINDHVFMVGDQVTNVGSDNPPLAPKVVACAALMANIAVNFILKG